MASKPKVVRSTAEYKDQAKELQEMLTEGTPSATAVSPGSTTVETAPIDLPSNLDYKEQGDNFSQVWQRRRGRAIVCRQSGTSFSDSELYGEGLVEHDRIRF